MDNEIAERLIVALNANTEAHGGKPSGGGGRLAAVAGKPAAAGLAKATMEQVKAALIAVREAHGKPAAVKIIKDVGGVPDMAGIKPARYTAVLAACSELMDDGGSGDEATDPDEDL